MLLHHKNICNTGTLWLCFLCLNIAGNWTTTEIRGQWFLYWQGRASCVIYCQILIRKPGSLISSVMTFIRCLNVFCQRWRWHSEIEKCPGLTAWLKYRINLIIIKIGVLHVVKAQPHRDLIITQIARWKVFTSQRTANITHAACLYISIISLQKSN